jgi:hypothetical protein
MLHVSTSDWTQTRSSCDGLWLERVFDWASDYAIFASRFGGPRDLRRAVRLFSQLRRDLIEIAMVERLVETLH